MHHSSSAQPLLLVIPGCVHSDTLFLFCLTYTSLAANLAALCLYPQKHTGCAWYPGSFPILWSVCVSRPLYCSVASAFAASAAQSCWLQILPYMVIHCSLPDSLPRPFPPCLAIGCFMQCRHTCEFWDRPKYEERPRWENWVKVRCCLCHSHSLYPSATLE